MKKRVIAFLYLLERDIDPEEVEISEQLFDFSTHEREAFSGSLEVHMQPLQKIMSHGKSTR